ncbi:phosphocarrier protein [Symbiobacterium terraclitae]|uniref:Phosphocarrier protein HPr n=1 Tax=Symbiobacterium terraclitae TaxID=557451 RepID=A0ABS4JUY1_9FIRM|nr:HPr family phosphocarrier protein [Symbiobacterium terraclitae]MBP2019379.1 phosphocarrier protein [Symbiobacterium terraclitae]
MLERTFTLTNPTGLHARPAALFVKEVQKFAGTEIFVRKGEREVSARSLLSLLSLGIGQGETIAIRCDGPQEEEAMAALAALIEGGFGE